MTKEQRNRLTTVKENLTLIQNACDRVQTDIARAEEAEDDEQVELLISLAEKELAGLLR